MNVMKQFRDGLFFQNPVTVQLLGMCSVMAITTTLFNGLGMGLSVLVILTLSLIHIFPETFAESETKSPARANARAGLFGEKGRFRFPTQTADAGVARGPRFS